MENTEELRVKDISKTDFQLWKHHPVSKLFFQLLRDKRDVVQQAAVGAWLNGKPLEQSEAMRGQIIELEDLSSIEFESISQFYLEDEYGTKDN